jgi:hypothetical protein
MPPLQEKKHAHDIARDGYSNGGDIDCHFKDICPLLERD